MSVGQFAAPDSICNCGQWGAARACAPKRLPAAADLRRVISRPCSQVKDSGAVSLEVATVMQHILQASHGSGARVVDVADRVKAAGKLLVSAQPNSECHTMTRSGVHACGNHTPLTTFPASYIQ